ncbi:MAG: translocation/assembly module TamB domain-containing protein [Rhodothermales bacterium]
MNQPNEHTAPPEKRRSCLGRILRTVGLAVVLLALVLAVLATPFGRNWLVQFALNRVPLTEGHRFTFDSSSGNVVTGLTLQGIRLKNAEDSVLIRIDNASVALRLAPLLSKSVIIKSLDVQGLGVNARQESDGSWNLVNAFVMDTTSSGLSIRIHSLRLSDGTLDASYHASDGGDSTLHASELALAATNISMVDRYAAVVQNLHASFVPPRLSTEADLRLAGAFEPGELRIDTLALLSSRTRLHVTGASSLPGSAEASGPPRSHLLLTANPVAFVDLAPFVPGLDPSVIATAEASVDGEWSEMNFNLSADLGSDGTLESAGVVSLRTDAPALVRSETAFNNLKLSAFDRTRFEASDVLDGTIETDLSGTTREQLSGTIAARFKDTDIGSMLIAAPAVNATFMNGDATWNASALVADQRVEATGTIEPFADVPTYSATIGVARFDVSRFGGSLKQWRTNVSAKLQVDGSGFSSPEVNAHLSSEASRVNGFRWNALDLTARIDSAASVEGSVTGASGDLTLRAVAGNLDSTASWNVSGLSLTSFDVGALLGDTLRSRITGTLAASGQGVSVEDMSFDATADIDSVTYADWQATAATFQLSKRGNRYTFRQDGNLEGARLQFAGTAVTEPVLRVTIDEGSTSGLDLGRFVENQQSDLNGSFSGSIVGTSAETATGSFDVTLAASRLNDTEIDKGTMRAEIAGGQVRFDIDIDTPGGGLALAGSVRPFGETPSITFERSRVRELDVAALTGMQDYPTSLNATIEGSLSGTTVATMRGSAEIAVSSSRINGIDGLDGALQLNATDSLSEITTNLSWSGGGAANGFVRRYASEDSNRVAWETDFKVAHLDIGGFVGRDSLESDLAAELSGRFRGRELRTLTGEGELRQLEGHFRTIQIDQGTGGFELNRGVLDLNQVVVKTNAGTLLADGLVAILNSDGADESNLSIDATIATLKPLGELVPRLGAIDGGGRLLAQVTGPPESIDATATLTLSSIEYKDRRVASVESEVTATFDADRALSFFDATAEIHNVVLPTATLRESTLHAALVDETFQFEGFTTIDNRRSAQLAGVLDPRESAKTIEIDNLSVRLDKDRWKLLQPSTITYGDGIRIKNLLLFTDNQQIALDGIVNPNGDQSLIMTIEEFRIESIADLFEYSGLGGTVNGYLDLTGPAESPHMEGDLNLDVRSDRAAVGDMQLSLAYDSLLLHTDALFRHVDGSTLTITGQVPIDLRLAKSQGPSQTGLRVAARQATPDTRVSIDVDADSFAMGWMLPFLNKQDYNALDGKVDGQLEIHGTVNSPALSGAAKIVNGSLGLPQFGIRPSKINAELEFDGNEIKILHADARSGPGSVIALGQVTLSDLTLGEFDVSLSMEDFLAMDNAQFRNVKTSGDLLLYGTTLHPNVSGYLKMESMDLYYEGAIEEFEPVQLSEDDLQQVEEVFGTRVTAADTTTFSFYEALQIDINLEMQRDSWLRSKQNPRMNIEFSGDMDLQKNPNEEERMFGTISVLPERSSIDQFGRRFDITSGTVTYNGDFDNPRVDIAATYTVRSPQDRNEEVTINLKASGALENLDVTLNSDPQMELTDILSYVLTGRPAGETLQFSGSEAGLATDIALSQATGYLEGLAGSELGLDVVRIENDGSEIRLTAGKYVRNGVYLAISQPVVLNTSATASSSQDANRPEFTVEVEIIRDLLARLLQQGSGFKLTLFWKHAY